MNVQFYIPEDMLTGILCGVIFIVACAIYVYRNSKRGTRRKDPTSEKRLINMLMGNKEAAERLIKYEWQRTPNASRKQCIAAAIERLQNDRGR